jgi:hypothetical protein
MIVSDDLGNDPGIDADVPHVRQGSGTGSVMLDFMKGESIIKVEQHQEKNPDQTTTMCYTFLLTDGKGFEVRVRGVIASAGVALATHELFDDYDGAGSL